MIKANELRIGNYIKLMLNDEDFVIVQVTLNDLEAVDNKKGLYEPIPLTEEWLLNFGFEKNDHLIILTLNKCTYLELDNNGDFYNVFIKQFDTTDKSINDTIGLGIELINVHELQNLYFVLKGEELEVKTKKHNKCSNSQ